MLLVNAWANYNSLQMTWVRTKGLAGGFINGWQLSGITQVQSGATTLTGIECVKCQFGSVQFDLSD